MRLSIKELVDLLTVPDGSLVFDIGAYKGEFAEELYKKSKCFIVMFEPNFRCHPYILGRKFIGQLCGNAIDAKNGKRELFLKDASSSFFENWCGTKEKITVVTMRLEEFTFSYGIPYLIKMNCEGAEYDIIKDAEGIMDRILLILVQFHKTENRDYEKCQEILSRNHTKTYQNKGWELWEILPNTGTEFGQNGGMTTK